jgi:ABC-2 type transport system ATP-binding protein
LLEQHRDVANIDINQGTLIVTLKQGVQDYSDLPTQLIQGGFRLTLFREEELNLETAFMELTKGLVQ